MAGWYDGINTRPAVLYMKMHKDGSTYWVIQHVKDDHDDILESSCDPEKSASDKYNAALFDTTLSKPGECGVDPAAAGCRWRECKSSTLGQECFEDKTTGDYTTWYKVNPSLKVTGSEKGTPDEF